MNRFASLIARLETVNDAGTKALIVADYLSETPEPDRSLAQKILDRSLKPRPVRLALIRGLADARIDADVFGPLSLEGSLASRKVLGGTAPEQVRAQIARHRSRLG